MPIMDMFRVNEIKAELARTVKERDALKKALEDTDKMEYHQLKQAIEDLCVQREKALQETQAAEAEFAKRRQGFDQQLIELANQIDSRKKEIIVLDEEILLESFALYKPKFKFLTSEEYKTRMEACRDKQKQLIKEGKAVNINENWTVNNSKAEGRKMVNDMKKLILIGKSFEVRTIEPPILALLTPESLYEFHLIALLDHLTTSVIIA